MGSTALADTTKQVRRKPDDIKLFDFLQDRYGPPELELPCRWCVDLGDGCVELEAATGQPPMRLREFPACAHADMSVVCLCVCARTWRGLQCLFVWNDRHAVVFISGRLWGGLHTC